MMNKRRIIIYGVALSIAIVVVIFYNINSRNTVAVLSSMLRISVPLTLGALCGLIGERTGIINIGIEGQMLAAAFTSFVAGAIFANIYLGLVIGVATGLILGFLHGVMTISLRIDQIIAGTVINLMAVGLTGYFYQSHLASAGKFSSMAIPILSDIPIIGPVLFDNALITYLSIVMVILVHVILFYTKWGLNTRSVGEHPRAAATVGINVYLVRYMNITVAGALSGLAGAFLTLEAVGSFERLMTNGRGFVALSVMIFSKWKPIGVWIVSLLFGFTIAMQTQLQLMDVVHIPPQFIGMMPYIFTIFVLAGVAGRTRAPAALGKPYSRESG